MLKLSFEIDQSIPRRAYPWAQVRPVRCLGTIRLGHRRRDVRPRPAIRIRVARAIGDGGRRPCLSPDRGGHGGGGDGAAPIRLRRVAAGSPRSGSSRRCWYWTRCSKRAGIMPATSLNRCWPQQCYQHQPGGDPAAGQPAGGGCRDLRVAQADAGKRQCHFLRRQAASPVMRGSDPSRSTFCCSICAPQYQGCRRAFCRLGVRHRR